MVWWNTEHQINPTLITIQFVIQKLTEGFPKNNTLIILIGFIVHTWTQGFVKGAILCFRSLYFYFRHGESTSTASQLTSPASQKSKDLYKVSLLLQDLGFTLRFELNLTFLLLLNKLQGS